VAVCLEEKASMQQKLNEKKKLEARSKRGKSKAVSTNPMAIPSKKIKIAGEGLRLSDGKKVPGYIASKKKAAPQTTAKQLLANGGSAHNSLADLFKRELSSRNKDETAMMRVVSVDTCNFTRGDHEIVGYKQVVFLNGIRGNDKNMDQVIIYNFDVVNNALRAAIQMLNFEARGIKINPTLIAERSPALFWSLVFEYEDKKIPFHQMLSEGLPNNDWTHLADGRVRKQSAKAMKNQRQETKVAAINVVPAMLCHDSLFRQAMLLISKKSAV